MGQTIVLIDSTKKRKIIERFVGGPQLFQAMYADIIPCICIDGAYRPNIEKARMWAKEAIPEFANTDHALHDLLARLESNENLWIYEVW